MELLNKDGILSFVLPNNFLNCSYYNLVREKIKDEFNILKIINHNSDTYLETEQETCSLIIQKKLLYHKKIHNMTIFNSTENLNKIDELQMNSTTLDNMGFEVYVGKCVWNQEKDKLKDNDKYTRLIYSGDIKDNKLVIFGWAMSDVDEHLIKKITSSKPTEIAIGIHHTVCNKEDECKRINSQLTSLKLKDCALKFFEIGENFFG